MIRIIHLLFIYVFLTACSTGNADMESELRADKADNNVGLGSKKRPNILLVMMDDLGYTDLGYMGSEINTPNIDELASGGVAMTNFHTAPTCSPSRAMLMSGNDNHLAGLGVMKEAMPLYPQLKNKPGYEGYLNDRVVALPQLLKDAGYRTYMSGKWHLGMTDETSPAVRGFEKSFALLDGGAGHFNNLGLMGQKPKASFREDGKLTTIPEKFYSSKFYAEKLIEYLQEDKDSESPFFAYLSFTAPHWPIQAPEKSIEKYKGKYDQGYEALFEQRLNQQKKLKLIDDHVIGQKLRKDVKPWDKLSDEEKQISAKKMEIYAAMIDDADRYLGKVIESLKSMGQYENTVIFFMSDNGAQAGEGKFPGLAEYIKSCCDNRYENMGKADSYLFTGSGWARASTGKSRLFKGYTAEGGILVPAFISYPLGKNRGVFSDQFLSVMDVLPTFLELAGVNHPGDSSEGEPIIPVKGSSFSSLLDDHDAQIHNESYSMGWELFGQGAIRQGKWKLLRILPPEGDGEWKLFNIEVDPTELNNLSEQYPKIFNELMKKWEQYKIENGVIEIEGATGF